MRLAPVAAIAAVVTMLTGAAQTSTGDQIVDPATAYVLDFLNRFSSGVAEEPSVQETSSPRRRRALRSDHHDAWIRRQPPCGCCPSRCASGINSGSST